MTANVKRAWSACVKYLKSADIFLLALCLLCSIFGILLIATASARLSGNQVTLQIGALVLGVVLFVLFSLVDVDSLASRWKALLVLNVALTLMLFLFGTRVAGTQAWIRFFGIGIQPSEIIKISFILTLAYHIHYLKEYKDLNSFFSVIQLLLHFGLMAVLVPDLGNATIFMSIFLVMLFLGGLKLRWFLFGLAILVIVIPLIFHFDLLHTHQYNRIFAPYDPSIDPWLNHWNMQAHRGRMAIGSGQVFGQGFGQGPLTQSGFVPEQWTDFILVSAGEELGFIGAMAVLVLLLLVIFRTFQVGAKARDSLSALVAAGIGAFMLFQTFLNIGMTIGLLPVVGIALPFFSYGGSSLVTTFIAMGIVCGINMRTVDPWKRRKT